MPEMMVAEPLADGFSSWTAREIAQQPDTLRATQALLRAQQAGIDAFLKPLLARPDLRILLAGAGTSAFIGECLAPWLSKLLARTVEAVATTDIVSAPALYLLPGAPTLMVSFGRSGTSPESIHALDLADAAIADVHHLIITCNADGGLAQRQGASSHVIVLPEATHDRGFAMTSSFTAMLLAALSVFSGIDTMDARTEAIAAAVAGVLAAAASRADNLAGAAFERVVYLGSGVHKGLAREAALKLLELTDGALVTLFDTTMGFRHGPKTIVTDRTLVVVFVSNDSLTRQYDLDLVEELRNEARCGEVLVVATQPCGNGTILVDAAGASDIDLVFPFVVPAQLFALACSVRLGLTPDRPSVSGTVSRVVQGVRIHAGGI